MRAATRAVRLQFLSHKSSYGRSSYENSAAGARLLCFSGAGFTAELVDEATRSGDLRLVTPADLYTGVLGLLWHADRQGKAGPGSRVIRGDIRPG